MLIDLDYDRNTRLNSILDLIVYKRSTEELLILQWSRLARDCPWLTICLTVNYLTMTGFATAFLAGAFFATGAGF